MWVAKRPESYAGRAVGNGHCVAFVRESSGAPHTSQWRRGPQARFIPDAKVSGVAIATFDTTHAMAIIRTEDRTPRS